MEEYQRRTQDTLKRVASDKSLSLLEAQAIVAEELGIDQDLFDISMFSEKLCNQVLRVCMLLFMNLIPKDDP
jgi:hypothetical protein